VDDFRLTITAPFCAGEVVTVGGAVCGEPLELEELPPSPHPHIKRPAKRKMGNIAAAILA
jgi:hypothetical protein